MSKQSAKKLQDRLSLPLIVAPMFLVSNLKMVFEATKQGVAGAYPALNSRSSDEFEKFLKKMTKKRAAFTKKHPDKLLAPYAVNLIVHQTNPRLEEDLALCIKYKVPVVITSLGAVPDLVEKIHSYGGIVLHDVTNAAHAKKALQAGVDGLIAVSAGAGGHAGTLNPAALIGEIRKFYDGTLILAGAMSTGEDILAAKALGADLVTMGTRFIATEESAAAIEYKDMICEARADEITYTSAVSGVPANFLNKSLIAAGFDLEELKVKGGTAPKLKSMDDEARAWKTIWSAGHGVSNIDDIPKTKTLIKRLKKQFSEAAAALTGGKRRSPDKELITTALKDKVLTIKINRPEKKNALNQQMYTSLANIISDSDKNPDVNVIMITGSKDAFSAGNDLEDFLKNPPEGKKSPVLKFLKALSETNTPIVAAVNGIAVGVGVTMLLHSDFVYMSEDAKLSLPFVDLGLVPEAGSSMLLPYLAGHQRAAELLMLGEPFSPELAKEIGLVNKICKAEELKTTALTTAQKLAKKPREALRQTKALMRRDVESVEKRIAAEAKLFKARLETRETRNILKMISGKSNKLEP